MSKLNFDEAGKRFYHTGVSELALFVKGASGYEAGVAWDGISNATVTPEGGDTNDIYADNVKYLSIPGAVNVNASITAYNYPNEFNACLGLKALTGVKGLLFGQQPRTKFAYVYKSKLGNDDSTDYGFVLNVLYNCLAAPSEISSDTVNESPEAAELSFDISTVAVARSEMPEELEDHPTSWVRIECKRGTGELLDANGDPTENLGKLLGALYGTENTEPMLLTPKQIYACLKDGTLPNAEQGASGATGATQA